jgi:hypothetical protein
LRVIIAGSRHVSLPNAIDLVQYGIEQFQALHGEITEIVSGGAPGIDTAAAIYANSRKVPFKEFPADWKTLGMAAGPIRNGRMAAYAREADGSLLLIWDGKSKGSKSMKEAATKKSLLIHEVMIP